jgi:hypothetical protein
VALEKKIRAVNSSLQGNLSVVHSDTEEVFTAATQAL